MNLQGSLQDLDRSSFALDIDSNVARRVIDKDTHNKLDDVITALGGSPGVTDDINIFVETTAIASGSETTLVSYTVPALKNFFLALVNVNGTNIATYNIYKNGTKVAKAVTFFGVLNSTVNFAGAAYGLKFVAADLLEVKVIHNRPSAGDFDARVNGVLQDV